MSYGSVGVDEIVGALEEIIGDDDDDEMDEALAEIIEGDDDDDDDDDDDYDVDIGARRRRRRRSKRGKRAARMLRRMMAARQIDPRAVMVRGQKRNRRRLWIVPIPATAIAAGGNAQITIAPQRLFKTQRIVIPSSLADDFEFTDIKVGQQSQYASAGAVPAGGLTEVLVDGRVDFDSADIGNQIVLEATNLDAVNPHTLRGFLLGKAVY